MRPLPKIKFILDLRVQTDTKLKQSSRQAKQQASKKKRQVKGNTSTFIMTLSSILTVFGTRVIKAVQSAHNQ